VSRVGIGDIAAAVGEGPAAVVCVTGAEGSTPREAGAHMLVTPRRTAGTIGGGEAERRAVEAARALLATGLTRKELSLPLGPELDQCCGGRMTLSIARIDKAPNGPFPLWQGGPVVGEETGREVWVYGAGHVGEALVGALRPLPFDVRWLDGRAETVWPVSAPDPLRRVAIPEAEVANAADDAFHVVLTHSHALDLEIVAAILSRPFGYCGLIGSRTKRATFERRLRERGIGTGRLTCPIGLPAIRGKEPAVIAASVAAQLLALDREDTA
jgi:xanthine dehydrogenase accessory protein XdhC